MKRYFSKYKIALAIVVYLIIVGAIFYWLINPFFGKITASNDKMQQTIIDQENKRKRLAEVPHLKDQFEMSKEEGGKMLPLPDAGNAVDLIKRMEKIAEETGNSIIIEVKSDTSATGPKKSVKPEDIKETIKSNLPSADYFEMSLKLTGKYSDLINFIKKLEALEYYADIISVNAVARAETPQGEKSSDLIFAPNSNGAEAKPEVVVPENKETVIDSSIGVVFYIKK
jgi:Tfp pilus assembly protein PilO